MELWRTIEEAPMYEVSDRGAVRNKSTQRILKPQHNGKGVMQVSLRDAGYTITRSVAALRKKAFD